LMTRATLTLKIADDSARKSLLSVLAPDNKGLPKGLAFSTGGRDSAVEFQFESASPSASLSTVLALLRDITLFQEVWLLSRGMDTRVRGG